MEEQLKELRAELDAARAEIRTMRRQAWIVRCCSAVVLALLSVFVATRPAATQLQVAAAASGGLSIRGPFTVTDSRRRPIFQVAETPLGRGLVVFDSAGAMITGVGINPSGRGVAVFDPQGKTIGGIGDGVLNANRARGVAIFDPNGNPVGALGIGNFGGDNGRGLVVVNQNRVLIAGLGVNPVGEGGVVSLRNAQGQQIFQAP
jgi:hypothetical protein